MGASLERRERHAWRKREMARLVSEYELTIKDAGIRLGLSTGGSSAVWKEIKNDLGPQAFAADLGWRPER